MHLELDVMIAKECVWNLFQSVLKRNTFFVCNHLFFTRIVWINPFLMMIRNLTYLLNFLFWNLSAYLAFLEKFSVIKKVINCHCFNNSELVKRFFSLWRHVNKR